MFLRRLYKRSQGHGPVQVISSSSEPLLQHSIFYTPHSLSGDGRLLTTAQASPQQPPNQTRKGGGIFTFVWNHYSSVINQYTHVSGRWLYPRSDLLAYSSRARYITCQNPNVRSIQPAEPHCNSSVILSKTLMTLNLFVWPGIPDSTAKSIACFKMHEDWK